MYRTLGIRRDLLFACAFFFASLIPLIASYETDFNASDFDIFDGSSFDWKTGNISLYHSESAYCDPSSYLTRTYKAPLTGFVPTYSIYDKRYDTRGYIGYTSSTSTIYVVFRGSSSIQNWLSDLDAVLTPYPLCSGCNVHKGFYDTEQSCLPDVLSQVISLKSRFPSYSVDVTGHSLGAALATLTAVDLKLYGITGIRLFNFGSPRIGDQGFATYVSSFLTDRNRVTHHKDIVVHSPTSVRMVHISGEWYEPDDTITLNPCTGYEDPNCSYQWSITSIDDHLYYLGLTMGGDGCAVIL